MGGRPGARPARADRRGGWPTTVHPDPASPRDRSSRSARRSADDMGTTVTLRRRPLRGGGITRAGTRLRQEISGSESGESKPARAGLDSHHAPSRHLPARGPRPRRPIRRDLLRRYHDDPGVLPAGLPRPGVLSRPPEVLRDRRLGRAGGLPAVPPLPAGAGAGPGADGRGAPAGSGSPPSGSRAGALNGHSVAELASELGVSERHLRRALERQLGVSPAELAQTHRLLLAKRLLAETSLPVTRIAFASGFQSLRRFNSVFRERYRLSPSALRRAAPASPRVRPTRAERGFCDPHAGLPAAARLGSPDRPAPARRVAGSQRGGRRGAMAAR